MKQILLMRHGDAKHHINDFARPLSELGRQVVTNAAYFLNKFNIEKVLCSPSDRTLETLNIVKTVSSISINDNNIDIIDKMYQSNVENIIDVIQQQPDDIQSLLIIGHNPYLYEFYRLTVAQQKKNNFKLVPACVIVIQYANVTSWASSLLGLGTIYDIFMPNY
ncbi:histidine phosphatase family protein [Orientia tsutsugamushi]|uniref:histidine phosphatase family protein n=1 Tax=Orientia tsutsugamushi TaxID=784 RepID=UPI0011BA614F